MLSSNWNATRFAQKPLHQPAYSFGDVPKAAPDLTGSSLQYVDHRDQCHRAMAEMLLLCKEAVRRLRPERRRAAGHAGGHSAAGGSKPLSLEYLADRFDVDDPFFGYLVRTQEPPPPRTRHGGASNADSRWQRGMLQGFITVTTFTNYQRTFQWNSHHPAAFSYDDEALTMERLNGERRWDADGRLAAELQATVRCGDIWNEGIVWPRIAEIALLGGLGCGGTLVKLVIEHLECLRPSAKCNYDYVVLQATENSIPFYESLGFVRVGAIVREENVGKQDAEDDEDEEEEAAAAAAAAAEPVLNEPRGKAGAVAQTADIVSSPLTQYTTQKPGETPNDITKKLNIRDVWDLIFLNTDLYPDMLPTSRLLIGTTLYIPVYEKPSLPPSPKKLSLRGSEQHHAMPHYYIAKEDDTPREIAKMFNVNCALLVEANKGRLEGLISNSRLMAGTRVKVSHLDEPEDDFKPYPHWSFPDDSFEDPEPSYMMAYKLNRRRGNKSRERPFLESLAVTVSEYQPTDLVLPPSPGPIDYDVVDLPTIAQVRSPGKRVMFANSSKKLDPLLSLAGAPKPPKRAPCAYMLYAAELRERHSAKIQGMSVAVASKFLGDKWRQLPVKDREPYEAEALRLRDKYFRDKAAYEKKLAAFKRRQSMDESVAPSAASSVASVTASVASTAMSLYNKVVRLKPGAMTEGSEYTYWYVLTYIPDLKWCHLAPMTPSGKFGDDKPKSKGRPIYRLVDEKLGKEVDISSSFCIPIKARAMKRTLDADKEEWDVVDDGSDPYQEAAPRPLSGSGRRDWSSSLRTSPVKPSTVPKPKPVAARSGSVSSISLSSSSKKSKLPSLKAITPKKKSEVTVKLVGKSLLDPNSKRRGRPRGSYGPKRMALLNGQEEVIIEIVSSTSLGSKRDRPKGPSNKEESRAGQMASPLTRSRVGTPQSSPSDSEANRRQPKKVRLSVGREGELKENFRPRPGASPGRSALKSESISFSSDSTKRRNDTRGVSGKTKTSTISSELVSIASPRRSPKRTVGPCHKRLRNNGSPALSPAKSRTRQSASPRSSEDMSFDHGKRKSPRFRSSPDNGSPCIGRLNGRPKREAAPESFTSPITKRRRVI